MLSSKSRQCHVDSWRRKLNLWNWKFYDRFLFTDNARMTTLVGEKFVVGMMGTLCDALESEYGILIPRLYRIFKPLKGCEQVKWSLEICWVLVFNYFGFALTVIFSGEPWLVSFPWSVVVVDKLTLCPWLTVGGRHYAMLRSVCLFVSPLPLARNGSYEGCV